MPVRCVIALRGRPTQGTAQGDKGRAQGVEGGFMVAATAQCLGSKLCVRGKSWPEEFAGWAAHEPRLRVRWVQCAAYTCRVQPHAGGGSGLSLQP